MCYHYEVLSSTTKNQKNLAISFQYLSCWWWGICGDLRSVRPSLIIEHHIDVSEHKHVYSCWPWTTVFAGLPQNFHVNPTSFKQRWSDPNFVPPRLTSDQLVEGHRPNQSPNHPKPPKLRLQDDPANTLTSRLGYQTFQRWFNHDNTISMPRIKIRCFHAFCSSSLKATHDLYPQGQDPSTIDLASYHQRVVITITPSHHHSIIVSALPSSRFWWVLEPLTYFSGTAFAPGMNCIHLPTATSHPGSREQKWLNNTAVIKMDWTIKCPLLITRMNRIHPYIYIYIDLWKATSTVLQLHWLLAGSCWKRNAHCYPLGPKDLLKLWPANGDAAVLSTLLRWEILAQTPSSSIVPEKVKRVSQTRCTSTIIVCTKIRNVLLSNEKTLFHLQVSAAPEPSSGEK